MKSSHCILFILLTGCVVNLPKKVVRIFPPTQETMIIRQSRYISNTATELKFEIDAYQLYGYDFSHEVDTIYFFNNLGLDPDHSDTTSFAFPNIGQFVLKGSGRVDGVSSVPSSSVILIDESGSYDTIDQNNNRSKGLSKLCQDFRSPAEFLLGGFSQNGKLDASPVDFLQNDFTTSYPQSDMPFLFSLATKTGGNSNLYDAISSSIDKLIAQGGNTKNIIVLAHTDDEVSNATLDNVITKATANQIQVHTIFRGQAASANLLAKLAQGTGGTFAVCQSVGEMMCTFEHLYSLLKASDQVYRLKVKFVPSSGTISSGQEFWFTIKTHDSFFDIDNNPIVAYIKIP